MRILILTPGFPQSEQDTTCIPSLQAMVRELHESYNSEIDIQVVSVHYPFREGSYVWHGIPCWSAGGSNRKFPEKLVSWLKVLKYINKCHRRNPIDIIHSFWLQECTLIANAASFLFRIRHIAHAMGQDVLPSNGYLKYFNKSLITLIANSPFSANQLVEHFGWKPQFVIPTGIRVADFSDIPPAENRAVDILSVGSLTEIKNHLLFIEIFSELVKKYPLLKGEIIGEGPLRQLLLDRIIEYGLQNNLQLTGKMERVDVLKCMAGSKILLHTSTFESAGYVFLEALQSGMKVVSIKTGFLPDVDGVYPCHDKTELLLMMNRLLSNTMVYSRVAVPEISETAKQLYNVYFNK